MASFRETIGEICNLLKEVAEKNETSLKPELFSVASMASVLIPESTMIEAFIDHSYRHWDDILSRKTQVIMEHFSDILGVSAELIPPREEWEKMILVLGEEKTRELWSLIHILVSHSLRHIHLERMHDGKSYTVAYFPEVKVRPYAEKLSLKL